MDQEARQELLRGLCSLLPFGVICWTPSGNGRLNSIDQTIFMVEYGINISATKREYFKEYEDGDILVKPYLRPMSSMTEKERTEYIKECNKVLLMRYRASNHYPVTDWLDSHFFDYRGFIDRGLALKALEGMYKTE